MRFNKAKPKGLTKEFLLSEIYSETFRINSCGPDDSPLAMYSVSSVDGLRSLWRYRRRLHDFMLYEIGKHLNISFNDFISLPRELVNEILTTMKARIDKANTEAARLRHKLDNKKQQENNEHDIYRDFR